MTRLHRAKRSPVRRLGALAVLTGKFHVKLLALAGNTEVTSDRAVSLAFIGASSLKLARINCSSFSRAREKSQAPLSERAFLKSGRVIWQTAAQLLVYTPFARRWVDIASGAGFPEMVVAILSAEMQRRAEVHYLESDRRKCAFLREVARATDAPARIHGRSHRNVRSLLVITCGHSHL